MCVLLQAAGCGDYFGKSLFFMGELGGNDYVFLLAANKTVDETKAYVPTVVNAIASGVEVSISDSITIAPVYVQTFLITVPFRPFAEADPARR
jgi:hypothetical protein